jgi:hypothetical protein
MNACESPVGLMILEGLCDDLRARVERERTNQHAQSLFTIDWQRTATVTTLLLSVASCLGMALLSLGASL